MAPDGRCVFLLGVNAVMRNTLDDRRRPRCDGIKDYIRRSDPSTAARFEWARMSSGVCGGIEAERPYGFNSVGAFSEDNDFEDEPKTGHDSFVVRPLRQGGAGAPYAVVIHPEPGGDDRALRADGDLEPLSSGFSGARIGDPYNPAFLADLDRLVAGEVAARRDDPQLQMWFCGNEIGMFDVGDKGGGVRDFRRYLWSDVPAGSSIDEPRCARHALAAFLRARHQGSIDDLNSAWDSTYPDFPAIVEAGPHPIPGTPDCNAACADDLQRFVHDRLLDDWVAAVTTRVRRADPNHLVASPRLAIAKEGRYGFWAPGSDHWAGSPDETIAADEGDVRYCPYDLLSRRGDAGFDLVALNAYIRDPGFPHPWFSDGLHKIQSQSGLPLIISEFSIRAKIEAWSNKGGADSFVHNQEERGERYASQVKQFAGFRHVVGAAWHAWSDRFIPGQNESPQINMGLVKCRDAERGMVPGDAWPEIDRQIAATNHAILQIIEDETGF